MPALCCRHAASPTSGSGRGRCQTQGPAWTMEIYLCWRAATRNASKSLAWQRLSCLQRYLAWNLMHVPMKRWAGIDTTWFSSHGVAASPAVAETHFSASSSTAQALLVWQVFSSNSDTFLPLHLPMFLFIMGQFLPTPCNAVAEELKGDLTTPALPPLSLARTLQIPARLMRRAKPQLWICFLQAYFVC